MEKLVFPWTFLVTAFLIRGCSPKINPLNAGRIDDRAQRAVSNEEYSQIDFLKQKLNHFLKCGAYCFAVPSDQDFVIRSRTPPYKLNRLSSFSWQQTYHQFQILKKDALGKINSSVNNRSCKTVNQNWFSQIGTINIPPALPEIIFVILSLWVKKEGGE